MAEVQENIDGSRLPLLPLRKGVLLPGSVSTLPVGRKRSLALVGTLEPGSLLVAGFQRILACQ